MGDSKTNGGIGKYFRQPWFAVVVTVLLAVTGLLGSVYSGQIARSLPLSFITQHPDIIVPVFWLSLAITAFLFWTQQRAVDKARLEAEMDVVERSRDLENLIRTLPPRNFLELFGQPYRLSEELAWNVARQEEPNREDVIHAIQEVLFYCCVLASYFDVDREQNDKTRYAANIMLLAYPDAMPEQERSVIEKSLRFASPETSIDKFYGVLFLRADLSSTSDTGEDGHIRHDRELIPLAIGVPSEIRTVDQKTGRERQWLLA